jgi:hypothetical protein
MEQESGRFNPPVSEVLMSSLLDSFALLIVNEQRLIQLSTTYHVQTERLLQIMGNKVLFFLVPGSTCIANLLQDRCSATLLQ